METNSFILANIGGLLDLEHYQLKWSSQQQEKGRESQAGAGGVGSELLQWRVTESKT